MTTFESSSSGWPDPEGLVAYFSTAGAGPIPKAAIEDADKLEDVFYRIKELASTGPPVSVSDLLNPPDWRDVAARGFFAYDWSLANKRYDLVARPSRSIRLSEIGSPSLRSLLERVRLPIRIADAQFIPADLDLE